MSAYSPNFAAALVQEVPSRYVETFALSAFWVVNHNLGREPLIQIFTTGGVEVVAELQQISPNQCTVSFSQPQAGRIIAF